jgi:hypothetical protein
VKWSRHKLCSERLFVRALGLVARAQAGSQSPRREPSNSEPFVANKFSRNSDYIRIGNKLYNGWRVDYAAAWMAQTRPTARWFSAVRMGGLKSSVSCAKAPYECIQPLTFIQNRIICTVFGSSSLPCLLN